MKLTFASKILLHLAVKRIALHTSLHVLTKYKWKFGIRMQDRQALLLQRLQPTIASQILSWGTSYSPPT